MKKILSLLTILTIAIVAVAQPGDQDPKAKKILDEISAKNQSYNNISVEFKKTEANETVSGRITVQGSSYYLKLKSGNEIYCNGKTHWYYDKDSHTVYINDAEEIADESPITPDKIFTIWESGFKFRYVEEKNGKDIINLFPKNPKDVEFHTVKLEINKKEKQVSGMIVINSDGTNTTYTVVDFASNVTVTTKTFIFDRAKYPGVIVVDQR
jgi:outer membrane lipoprotein carrier protein